MNPAQKKYYSVKEAARLLGVSTNTLYKYLDDGKIHSRRIGKGRFKIPQNDLLPFVEQDQLQNQVAVSTYGSGQPGSGDKQANKPVNEVEAKPVSGVVTDLQAPEGSFLVQNPNTSAEQNPITSETENNDIFFGTNDILIFRIFKSLVFSGLGLIYILTSPRNYALETLSHSNLNQLLMPLLPYALLVSGIIYAFEAIYFGKKPIAHFVVDMFISFVTGYYALISLISGNYGLFVFTISLCGMSLEHLISGVKDKGQKHTFQNSFVKFVMFLTVMGGIIVTLIPESFPIVTVVDLISRNREIFAFCWFMLLFLPAAYLVSPKGEISGIRVPYFTIGSILALIISVKSMLIPNWDIAYISFLTGVFGLFLAWWIESKNIFDVKKLGLLFIAFFWMALIVLVAFFTLDAYIRQAERKNVDGLQSSLDNLTNDIASLFDERSAVLVSFAGKESVSKAIENGEGEGAITEAKNIYDQVGNISRVIIFNKDGTAVGVYPRSSLTQGTDFSSREYFQKTLQGKKSFISDEFTNVLGDTTFMQTEPIFQNNEVFGLIGISTHPTDLANALLVKQRDYDMRILDSQGKFVMSSGKTETDENINTNLLAKTKTDRITLTRQIDRPNWKISISNLPQTTPDNLQTLATSLIAIMVLNSMFSIFAGVMIARKKNKNVQVPITTISQNPEFLQVTQT